MTDNSCVTVVIPTTLSNGVLYTVLSKLNDNVVPPDNVVLVVDKVDDVVERLIELRQWLHSKVWNYRWYVLSDTLKDKTGAGEMRNVGVEFAMSTLTQDVIVFIGDDCIPEEGMILAHIKHHITSTDAPLITQGYSPFSPRVLGTPFMSFFNKSGIAANWSGVLTPDGKINDNISGFFLTTNVGVSVSALQLLLDEHGRVFPPYPNAAWEDIVVGKRALTLGIKTVFVQDSVVHHEHEHDPISAVRRQMMEGRNRILFCTDYPQTANMMLPVVQINHYIDSPIDIGELITTMNGFNVHPFPQSEQVVGFQENLWMDGLQSASLQGAVAEISQLVEFDPIHLLQVYPHLANESTPMLIFSALGALRDGDKEYLEHTAHWIYQHEGNTFASHFFAGLVYTNLGNYLSAHTSLVKAIELNSEVTTAVKLLSAVTKILQQGNS